MSAHPLSHVLPVLFGFLHCAARTDFSLLFPPTCRALYGVIDSKKWGSRLASRPTIRAARAEAPSTGGPWPNIQHSTALDVCLPNNGWSPSPRGSEMSCIPHARRLTRGLPSLECGMQY